jgi:allantoate deiminase
LYERNIPVAIVTGIAGQKRVEITFKGMAGHAGTVPMHLRNDALCCAAEFVLETEKLALAKEKLVATIGKLNITNAASNVIPGEVVCSVDIRSADEQVLSSSYEALQAICKNICQKRNVDHHWNAIQGTKPVACDQQLNMLLAQSIKDAKFEVVELVSGAGHDAVPISEVSPVSMLFVRCYKGISHNPLEDVAKEDIAAAIEVSDNFINHLITYNQH